MNWIQKLSKKLERLRKQLRDRIHIRELKKWFDKYKAFRLIPIKIRDEEIWIVDVVGKTAKTDTGRTIKINPEIWNKYKKKDKIVKYEVQTGFGITRSGKKVRLVVNPKEIPDFIVAPSGNVYDMRRQGQPSYKSPREFLGNWDDSIEPITDPRKIKYALDNDKRGKEKLDHVIKLHNRSRDSDLDYNHRSKKFQIVP